MNEITLVTQITKVSNSLKKFVEELRNSEIHNKNVLETYNLVYNYIINKIDDEYCESCKIHLQKQNSCILKIYDKNFKKNIKKKYENIIKESAYANDDVETKIETSKFIQKNQYNDNQNHTDENSYILVSKNDKDLNDYVKSDPHDKNLSYRENATKFFYEVKKLGYIVSSDRLPLYKLYDLILNGKKSLLKNDLTNNIEIPKPSRYIEDSSFKYFKDKIHLFPDVARYLPDEVHCYDGKYRPEREYFFKALYLNRPDYLRKICQKVNEISNVRSKIGSYSVSTRDKMKLKEWKERNMTERNTKEGLSEVKENSKRNKYWKTAKMSVLDSYQANLNKNDTINNIIFDDYNKIQSYDDQYNISSIVKNDLESNYMEDQKQIIDDIFKTFQNNDQQVEE